MTFIKYDQSANIETFIIVISIIRHTTFLIPSPREYRELHLTCYYSSKRHDSYTRKKRRRRLWEITNVNCEKLSQVHAFDLNVAKKLFDWWLSMCIHRAFRNEIERCSRQSRALKKDSGEREKKKAIILHYTYGITNIFQTLLPSSTVAYLWLKFEISRLRWWMSGWKHKMRSQTKKKDQS